MRTWILHEDDDGSRHVFEVLLYQAIELNFETHAAPLDGRWWYHRARTLISVEGEIVGGRMWYGPMPDDDMGELSERRAIGDS